MPGPLGIGGGGGGSGITVTAPVFPFIDRAVAQTSDTGSTVTSPVFLFIDRAVAQTSDTGSTVTTPVFPFIARAGAQTSNIGSIAFATPGSSAIGDTAAAGTATTVSRSDHVHGRETAGTPGASAVGDTASAGVATTVARSDHRHSREAFGTTITASTIGGTAAAGTSTSVAREDHKHAFPAGAAPSALTVSSTQVTGTSTAPALADHVHAMPGSGTPGASAVGDTASAGTATTVALSDHRHSREAFGTPVNLDASLTSLSAGSLTTVARADHVHTVSNAWTKIASTVTSGSATSITFSSIPQTFQHLRILGWARSAYVGLASGVMIRFNGDSGSNYNDAAIGTGDYTSVRIGILPGTTQYYANSSGFSDIQLNGYSGTAFLKGLWIGYGAPGNTTSTYSQLAAICHGQWRSTAAITSIVISQDTGAAFVNGSIYTLMAC